MDNNITDRLKYKESVIKFSKLDLVYPIKNGIEEAKKKTNNWLKNNLK